jgi:hypothetical protein
MGLVKDVYAYKFVDGKTGEIQTNIGYKRVTPRRGIFRRFHK